MTAMEDGNRSLKSIMTALDQVYGGATTYTALLHKLNSIQQAHGELAKDYYECVVQIRVKLQEFHRYMFRPGDLEHQAKEAFFNGLCPEFQLMVVHKRTTPAWASLSYLSPWGNARRIRRTINVIDRQNMPRHTRHPRLGMTTIVTEIRTPNQIRCHKTKVKAITARITGTPR